MLLTKKKRVEKDKNKISVVNLAINEFFKDKEKNTSGERWFSTIGKPILPKELREIYNSIRRFFKNKKWYNGGSIPDELLYTRRNFRLVNNISLIDAIDLAYDCINKCKKLKSGYRENIEVLITIRLVHECERKEILQEHIGGLLILYLELCERVVLL